MLLACCWLDFGKEAQRAAALQDSGEADGSQSSPKHPEHSRRRSLGPSRAPVITTSLHPALYEQVTYCWQSLLSLWHPCAGMYLQVER